MGGPQRALKKKNKKKTGRWSPSDGLRLGFCVCSRDLQELNPPEKEKAALQYASWGPQGNQLVRLPLPRLPNRCVVFVICPSI